MKRTSIAVAVLLLASAPAFADDPHAGHQDMTAAPVDHGESVYHLEGRWTDHRGADFTLASLRGGPVVIVMLYGSCTSACPILVHDAHRLESLLVGDVRKKTQFVLVSFDPVNDTPETLADYATGRGLDDPGWRFVQGDRAQIRALAMLLGVRYRDNGDGTFDHSNLITVLDADGRAVHRVEGLMRPMDAAATAVAGAAR
ncbi:MAG: SCO family protein [Gammaproteobacteria bacterium]